MDDLAQTILTRQLNESAALHALVGVTPQQAIAVSTDATFMAGFNQGVGAMALIALEELHALALAAIEDDDGVPAKKGGSVGAAGVSAQGRRYFAVAQRLLATNPSFAITFARAAVAVGQMDAVLMAQVRAWATAADLESVIRSLDSHNV